MAERVDINGHPTWAEDRGGSGMPLLLLHGDMGASDDLLNSIGPELAARYRLVAFDRRGHGYTADTAEDFHYGDMAGEAIRVLEGVVGGPAHLVGRAGPGDGGRRRRRYLAARCVPVLGPARGPTGGGSRRFPRFAA